MHIHFIAVGGAIMHQLAIVSKEKGYQVSGSDDKIADPARSNLQKAGLLPEKEGWFPEKITSDLDVVILGMHALKDNPELQKALDLGLKVLSFPEYIYENSKDKLRVVIAGSHGKTTITSMVMHVLKAQNMDFDYLVGAKLNGFEHSVRLSHAPVIILEGDEYPASVLEKRPKIHFYHPEIAVITGIAWDHINVFPSFENYKEQFSIFIDALREENTLIYNAQDREVISVIEADQPVCKLFPYATPNYENKDGVVVLPTDSGEIPLKIFGNHNLLNLEAARRVCSCLGVSNHHFYKAIQNFSGAARRLEKIKEDSRLVVYRDFAHAPSKLKATLAAVREQYPDRKLIACFELHTFSSLSADFLNQYQHCMDPADQGAVFYSRNALRIKRLPSLSTEMVLEGFADPGLTIFEAPEALRSWVQNQIDSSRKPVCLLLMSSGTFDGMDINFKK